LSVSHIMEVYGVHLKEHAHRRQDLMTRKCKYTLMEDIKRVVCVRKRTVFISFLMGQTVDLHIFFSILWKSMGSINCLVTEILQNIFFCVQLKKETPTSFFFFFWVNYHFKGILHFFWDIGSFYNSPRGKQLSFTVFKSIQPIF